MFKISKDDLTKKTDAQLAALFQEASLGLAAKGSALAVAQWLLAMIRAETACRGPKGPGL